MSDAGSGDAAEDPLDAGAVEVPPLPPLAGDSGRYELAGGASSSVDATGPPLVHLEDRVGHRRGERCRAGHVRAGRRAVRFARRVRRSSSGFSWVPMASGVIGMRTARSAAATPASTVARSPIDMRWGGDRRAGPDRCAGECDRCGAGRGLERRRRRPADGSGGSSRRDAAAAPRLIEALGSASTATGSSSSTEMSWATAGMRDEPPMSRTAVRSSSRVPRRPPHSQGLDGSPKVGVDHLLELGAHEPNTRLRPGQEHGHDRLGVERERLLRVDAVASHAGEGERLVGLALVDVVERFARERPHVLEDPLVEVGAARCSMPDGAPITRKASSCFLSSATSKVPPPRS